MEPKTIEYDGKSCELTEDDLRYGKLAGDDAAKGRNPASWVEDEAAWEKAKEAADKNKGADDYYALVTHIYKQMGGGIKSQKASPSPKEMRARRRMAADTSLQSRLAAGGLAYSDLMERLRQEVIAHFPAGTMPFVIDVVMPEHEAGEIWDAIVQDQEGKLWCSPFTIGDDDGIHPAGSPQEIKRAGDYEYVQEENDARYQERREDFLNRLPAKAKDRLDCRAKGAAEMRTLIPALEDGVLMYMPGGLHAITPMRNGRAVDVSIAVDAATADALEEQRKAIEATGNRVFFSLQHETDIAAFWVRKFFWDRRLDARGDFVEGVWAEGDWTKSGREAVEGKDFRTFSPTFHVDAIRNDAENPCRVTCEKNARPNMGALENDPAFQAISPLWAKSGAGATGEQPKHGGYMTDQDKAQLQARLKQLEQKVSELSAKSGDATASALLAAAQAEQKQIAAELRLAEIEAQKAALEQRETRRREQEAESAVARMVAGNGAVTIPPLDKELQSSWRAKFVADPTLIPLMAGPEPPVKSNDVTRTNANAHSIATNTDLRGCLRAIGALCAKSGGGGDMRKKFEAAREIGELYKREIKPLFEQGVTSFPLEAAEAKDTLGTLAGTLVALRTLDLYKFEFPMLDSITTDFSDQPAQFNQTTSTRIIVVPSVDTYDATLGADGRPKGWVISTPAQTVDANVTLNQHKAVTIVFDANVLASTQRRLFEEMGPASAYALGKNVVDALYAVITDANFGDNAPFSVLAINYGRPTFSKAKRILNLQGVPFTNRFALSASDYQETLEQDSTLVNLAVYQKPEIITEAELPLINRFRPIEAPNLPPTDIAGKTLKAFFAHQTALLMQARVPNDWNAVLGPGNSYGTVNVVTNPDTGLSVLLVQFSNPQSAHAEYRIALMYGVAKGNSKGGQIVTN